MTRVMNRLALAPALVLFAVALALPRGSSAQDALTRRDGRGAVTVAVTLAALPASGEVVRAKVALDTHSVALDAIPLQKSVVLPTPDGKDVPPTGVEQAAGSGHHRSAVLVFPPVGAAGPLRVVVKDVGGIAERTFTWDLPAPR